MTGLSCETPSQCVLTAKSTSRGSTLHLVPPDIKTFLPASRVRSSTNTCNSKHIHRPCCRTHLLPAATTLHSWPQQHTQPTCCLSQHSASIPKQRPPRDVCGTGSVCAAGRRQRCSSHPCCTCRMPLPRTCAPSCAAKKAAVSPAAPPPTTSNAACSASAQTHTHGQSMKTESMTACKLSSCMLLLTWGIAAKPDVLHVCEAY